MLVPTGGGRLFISELPVASWTEIAHVEALGSLGMSWNTETIDYISTEEVPFAEVLKTTPVPVVMQIVVGIDAADPGQIKLWQAVRSYDDFAFKLQFPGGLVRAWRAKVTAFREVFDTANSVLRLQADLHVCSYDREATAP